MGILQTVLLFFVLAGFARIFQSIRGFFLGHPRLHLTTHATKYAFVITGLLAAIISVPMLTLGLPGIFRLATFGVYIVVALIGLAYGYDILSKLFNRGGGNGANGGGNGTTGTK